MLTGKTFKDIRVHVLKMTQREMAQALGYRHKIRVSEYEREINPVRIPQHISNAVLLMGEDRWHLTHGAPRAVRKYTRSNKEKRNAH